MLYPRRSPRYPVPIRRTPYLLGTTVLFVTLSFGIHAAIELAYLRWAEESAHPIHWYSVFGSSCALHPAVAYGLLALGLLAGPLTGRVWWRWVYVEGKHWKRFPFHHA